MEFGFALVPILAGYWFLTRTHLLKHPYESKTHHRVIFEPAIAGGALTVISWISTRLVGRYFEQGRSLGRVGDLWREIVPFDGAGVLALTVALAIVIPALINWRVDAIKAANRWAAVNESTRGRLLRESLESGGFVEISLNDGRSLVGIVETPSGDFEGDISLAPELSGYRDPNTHRLILTTYYGDVEDGFRIVSLLKEVKSISHFDPDAPDVEWLL